jgi:hypothetical protein
MLFYMCSFNRGDKSTDYSHMLPKNIKLDKVISISNKFETSIGTTVRRNPPP